MEVLTWSILADKRREFLEVSHVLVETKRYIHSDIRRKGS